MKPVGNKELLEWINDEIPTVAPMGMGPRDGSGPRCNPDNPLNKILEPEVIVKKVEIEPEPESALPRSEENRKIALAKLKLAFSEINNLLQEL